MKIRFEKIAAVLFLAAMLIVGSAVGFGGPAASALAENETVDIVRETAEAANLQKKIVDALKVGHEADTETGDAIETVVLNNVTGKAIGDAVPYLGLTAVPERFMNLYDELAAINLNDSNAAEKIAAAVAKSAELGFDTVCDVVPGLGGVMKSTKNLIKEGVSAIIDWF